jgi:hypothetical protein
MFNESMMILHRDYYTILHYNARAASDSSLCGRDDIQEAHVCLFSPYNVYVNDFIEHLTIF